MDIFPKFIIEDGNLIIGKVTYHSELMYEKENVSGGGWFNYKPKLKTFTFFGSSHDFGKSSLEDVKKAVLENRVYSDTGFLVDKPLDNKEYKFVYRTDNLEEIILNNH